MLEIVRAFRDALGIESTSGFVAVMALGFAVIGAGAGWIVDKAYKKSLASRDQYAAAATVAAQKPTALFVDYDVANLLQPVHPNTTLSVLRLHPKLEDHGFFQTTNGTNEAYTWPVRIKNGRVVDRTPNTSMGQLMGFIRAVTVTNRGEATVLSVELKYRVRFQKPGAGGNVTASDPIVESKTFTARIPPLAEKESFRFLIVNASPLVANVENPKEGLVQVFGEASARSVPVLRAPAGLSAELMATLAPLIPLAFKFSDVPAYDVSGAVPNGDKLPPSGFVQAATATNAEQNGQRKR